MKRNIIVSLSSVALASLVILLGTNTRPGEDEMQRTPQAEDPVTTNVSTPPQPEPLVPPLDLGTGPAGGSIKPRKGPDQERWYFSDWHRPYGAMLSRELLDEIWRDVASTPSEGHSLVNSWDYIGPWGMITPAGARFSGRVLDIEPEVASSLRIASASGGLWTYFFFIPIPLSDGLNSLAVGSFATHPGNENIILVGTGEPGVRTGMGIFKTTDGGTNWTNPPMSPAPESFYKLRYTPDGSMIHAATRFGHFRSTDGGESWTNRLYKHTSDLAIHPTNPSIVYIAVIGEGLYKSTDAGWTWNQETGPGLPTSGVRRGAIAIAPSNPNVIYVAFADGSEELHGIYRTTNGGVSWNNVSPTMDYMLGQGWYDNVITVSPLDPDIVLAGGVNLIRSTNGGVEFSWSTISSTELHVDYHAFAWGADGTSLWVGHDGGWSISNNSGLTWDTTLNLLPITQYGNIHVGFDNVDVMAGGSQDNGTSVTTNGGVDWYFTKSGDGGGVSIDPNDASRMWMTIGFFGGSWAWIPHRSTDYGFNWTAINSGVDPAGTWFTDVVNDQVNPVYLYTNSGGFIYESTNYGDLWTKLNPTGFPANPREVTASRYEAPKALVYSPLGSDLSGQQLRVYDDDGWYERSSGLPTGAQVRTVAPHPTDKNKACLIMNGLSTPTQKVFRTTNRGETWINMTGDLPNLPVGDIVAHPDDDTKYYLGTEFGCYRTTNTGQNWHRWNNGLPGATIVTQMAFMDLREQTGEFFVVAGTFGRGLFKREITGDDPTSGIGETATIVRGFELQQNYPNPFRGWTTIEFALPSAEAVSLKVYDVGGREVGSLVDGHMDPGVHRVDFDSRNLPAGTYFYRLNASKVVEQRKMVILD